MTDSGIVFFNCCYPPFNMPVRHFPICIISMLCFVLSTQNALAQSSSGHTDQIESLIDEWNFANNTRNLHSFESVYADRVSLDGKSVSKRTAIARKQQLFRTSPSFRQRITTEIRYTLFRSDVTKCEFKTQVYERGRWKEYLSFLLVSHANNHYAIVGESSVAVKAVSKEKSIVEEPIAVDEPITVDNDSQLSKNNDSSTADSLPPLPAMEHPDSIDEGFAAADLNADTTDTALAFTDPGSLLSDLSSMGVITVPRGYVFILIGMLGLGGLMIFIADIVQSKKRRRVRISGSHAEAAHVVHDFKTQAMFEAFVVTLFDPLYFKCFRPKGEHVYAGNGIGAEKGPDLIFDYSQKETSRRFAITCQYYRESARNEVQVLSGDRQEFIRQFEADREMDVYYVLGFGGKPDDPRELFFVPASEVRREYMTRAQLRQYSKSGMFYFNKRTERIQ